MTADCPKGAARVRRRRTLAVTAAFGALAVVLQSALIPVYGEARVRRIPTRPVTPLPVVPSVSVMGDAIATPKEPDIRMGEVAVAPKDMLEATMGKAKAPVEREEAGP